MTGAAFQSLIYYLLVVVLSLLKSNGLKTTEKALVQKVRTFAGGVGSLPILFLPLYCIPIG